MAHTKSAGSTANIRDSKPKYRGIKIHDGQSVKTGNIIVRQTGSRVVAGEGVRTGRDFTLYAIRDGIVRFTTARKIRFDRSRILKKIVSIT